MLNINHREQLKQNSLILITKMAEISHSQTMFPINFYLLLHIQLHVFVEYLESFPNSIKA